MTTWNQWLNWAYSELQCFVSAKIDAELILKKVVNISKTQMLAFGNTILKYDDIVQLRSLINRRKKGEPIAYLIGSKEFWSLNFRVSSETFIPRPDTECIIEQILQLEINKFNVEVLDLGTGVGTIALTLASERPNWNIIGIDIQKQALVLSCKNKFMFNIKNVQFIYGNWFKYLKKKFNIIVSNPPYINQYDPCLLSIDMSFEPRNALISKNLGLFDLTTICQNSIYYLYSGGWLFLEHGWNQGEYMRTLFHKNGFSNICTVRDYNFHERITYGQWKIY